MHITTTLLFALWWKLSAQVLDDCAVGGFIFVGPSPASGRDFALLILVYSLCFVSLTELDAPYNRNEGYGRLISLASGARKDRCTFDVDCVCAAG